MEPVFDPEVIAGLRALDEPGEQTFFQDILFAYLDTCLSTRSGLQAAVDARELAEVRRLAHGLKGASLNVGARSLAERCRALEDAARQGDLDGVIGERDAFLAIADQVVTEAKRMAAGESL